MMKTASFLTIVISLLLLVGPSSGIGKEKPIRIGYLQSDIHQLACWVALEKGLYQKHGVEVEVAGIFKAGPEEMSAFAAGALDMGYVGEAPATTAVANKAAEATVLAQVNTEGSAIVVGKDAPVKDMRDLAGKRVAIPGHSTVQDFLLKKALTKFNVDQKSVNIIVLKPPEMIGALKTGQIDAFIAWEPYPAKARTMGVGRVLLTSHEIWENHPCCVLVVSNRFLSERPQDARAVVKAHVEATDYIKAFPEEAVRIGVKYTGMDEPTVRLAMKNVNYTYALSVDGEREYVDFLSRMKYISLPDTEAFVEKFINQKILGEIINQ
jgi:NitT/TauT family transport system substrate-binding protein